MFLSQLIVAHVLSFTEFMSRGSLYDFLHKQRGVFNLPSLLKVAINISRGMNYLHQNNIIHRDLKTANLLMDENMVRELHKTVRMRNLHQFIAIHAHPLMLLNILLKITSLLHVLVSFNNY